MKDPSSSADARMRIPAINLLVPQIKALFGDQAPAHNLCVRLARLVAAELRVQPDSVLDDIIRQVVYPLLQPGPKPVINATGILLHTNLGRSPLSMECLNLALEQVIGFTDLELDLDSGKRGHRDRHFAALARLVWGAEDATLVNNAAAAVTLSLAALGAGGETVVSRGELVEIGGSFRLPDIISLAASKLVEVGTTNRTNLADYKRAIGTNTACLLKTHPSNFRVEGFTASVPLLQLVKLGRSHHLPVVMDLGSGLSRALSFPDMDKPFVEDFLAADPDILIFSGDKMFASIQAGIVLGKKKAISCLRKHPMMRILRVDKLSISVICHQLRHIMLGGVQPFALLVNTKLEELRLRAQMIKEKIHPIPCEVVDEYTFMGGGSLPQERRESLSLTLRPSQHDAFARAMRLNHPPVIGYLRNGAFHLNLASVFAHQDGYLIKAICSNWQQ